ncbi:DNA mismatch repair endonuclease MutL [Lonepinella sp. BR2474]|uniref:DNA mismatch repair endonuclease MutL n=1 Tax=Lonepinella sp. BR2474 TaxID=3434548 RepID=UPI003F6E0BC7
MTIQILPPQLANQIAAGEVVERPASVVKELVENSLDAGANRIQIDIEHGGATLIRIRDNGIGIAKQELALALARHATSKITCLEDLEAILSLGFRGEALASISSVSRLTLTSRTAEQNEAWQVYVQGRDQQSTITPASHPVGTTVEVANLFFNTPARRKFLRTDKTEFAHIDEVIRRIALAKSQIAFTLTHNGKIMRQYKSAVEKSQILKRVAAICGEDFVQHALHINWKHDDLHLSGWVATPQFTRTQNDLSYCYINGRMVKDKVITHAIRQAYADYLGTEQYPAFVLFLDLNPNEVDVNVHPTKHEVRFQQARLIHDFIFQGVSNALLSAAQLDLHAEPVDVNHGQVQEPQAEYHVSIKPNRQAAGENIFSRHSSSNTAAKSAHFPPHFTSSVDANHPTKTEQRLYAELIKTTPTVAPSSNTTPSMSVEVNTAPQLAQTTMLRALALVENRALLLQQHETFYLLPLAALQKLALKLTLTNHAPKQPLLIPVVFRLAPSQRDRWQQQQAYFAEVGFEFVENVAQQRLTLNQIPVCLRQQNLQKIVLSLLNLPLAKMDDFRTALIDLVESSPITTLASAVNVLQGVEQHKQAAPQLSSLLINVDFSPYLD